MSHNHCSAHHHEHEHSHCCCSCHHHEEHNSAKPLILRLICGTLLATVGIFFDGRVRFFIFAFAYLILGYDVLKTAGSNILRGKIFDENFLMSIATIGAFILQDYPEAAAVMLFYQLGELLSHQAVERSKSSITALMDTRPDTARVLRDGVVVDTKCTDIKIGDTVIVSAGERIPVDGVISRGEAMLDTASLTGEALPRPAEVGSKVLAGMICTDSTIEITVRKEFGDSTLSRILDIAQNAQEKKSHSERFITTFARIYTPGVVAAAVLCAILPPLLGFGSFSLWISRSLTFLVASCPCALVVSIPLTFFAGIGCASKQGILIKNSSTLEKLAKVNLAAFDKTGTLTYGKPQITEIRANGSKAELLMLAAYAECDSTHPIAQAICSEWKEEIDRSCIERITEIPARGVEAVINSKTVLAGSAKLLSERNITINETHQNSVYVAVDGKYFGYLSYSDSIKSTAAAAIDTLSDLGIHSVMLSGDLSDTVEKVANEVGIDTVHSELLPQQKAEIIEQLEQKSSVLFVGDGMNDAPSLACASVGMAMGAIGSDAAIESADAVIMGDDVVAVPTAIRLSRRTMRLVRQNTALSVGIKLAVMVLIFFGIGGMWPAIFADVGVCLITVLNGLRAFFIKNSDIVAKPEKNC